LRKTLPLVRALVAESIGTFALVFAGCGAIMVDAKTGQLGHVGVAISFGLVIMFGVYAVGHISGAHFNAAVTFAFALTRHFPWPRAVALPVRPRRIDATGRGPELTQAALAADVAIVRGLLPPASPADVSRTRPSSFFSRDV
jgi:aquaporin NIP